MAQRQLNQFLFIEDALDDGYVRVDSDAGTVYPVYTMNNDTFRALSRTEGSNARLRELLDGRTGTYLIPRQVIEPDAAADLRLSLSFTEPEPSSNCIYTPCPQAATVRHPDGFDLCSLHFELMRDWDDLLV